MLLHAALIWFINFALSVLRSHQVLLLLSVRGMMYYRKALELQAFLDMAEDDGT